MNKDPCPFITGNDRMNLIVSEGHLLRLMHRQFEKNSDHPFFMIEQPDIRNPVDKQQQQQIGDDEVIGRESFGSSANDFHTQFLQDLQCIVCHQIPYELEECQKCNKILCRICQAKMSKVHYERDPGGNSSDEDAMAFLAQHHENPNKVCPNCKDPGFVFQAIAHRTMKSMLNSLKVMHKCTQQKEGRKFYYEELRKHIMTECGAFKYDCRLCVRAVRQRHAETQIQQQLSDLNQGRQAAGEKVIQFDFDDVDKLGDVIEVGRDKLNDPINIVIREPKGNKSLSYQDLEEHLRSECGAVTIQCHSCHKYYRRIDFRNHQCFKSLRQIDRDIVAGRKSEVLQILLELSKIKKEGVDLNKCFTEYTNFETIPSAPALGGPNSGILPPDSCNLLSSINVHQSIDQSMGNVLMTPRSQRPLSPNIVRESQQPQALLSAIHQFNAENSMESGQIDSSSQPLQQNPGNSQMAKSKSYGQKCSEKFGADPDYAKSQKLKIVQFGNCEYCEVSIQKVFHCQWCKRIKCENCIKEIYIKKMQEML